MASMNKPTFAAICTYSPTQPALVFVASRRQTRLTALELIALCALEENPRRFLRLPEAELAPLLARVRDPALRHTLAFGVGIHHAGLAESDRAIVEQLFVGGKAQVLVCTSTLAWGVNFPAHLVVVKGTEFFDARAGRYVDFPVTDVLQMMGRAGRPQFDTHGVAAILVHEPKKQFYRKFLYEPFPVESQLRRALHDHVNAEVAGGTIASRADAADWLTWTFFFRRLLRNPTYYGLDDATDAGVRAYLLALVDETVADLERAGCVVRGAGGAIASTPLGAIAAAYYLRHATAASFAAAFAGGTATAPHAASPLSALTRLLCDAAEFDELPVRHGEDELNARLAADLPWRVRSGDAYDSPHVKAFLLLQARMARAPLPIADYANDTKTCLDQSLRTLNALIDVAANAGCLQPVLRLMHLAQCIVMASAPDETTFAQLQGAGDDAQAALAAAASPLTKPPPAAAVAAGALRWLRRGVAADDGGAPAAPAVADLFDATDEALRAALRGSASADAAAQILRHLRALPRLSVAAALKPAGAARDVLLHVTLQAAAGGGGPGGGRAVTPAYAKKKEWGWWLVVGDGMARELLALKRVGSPAPGQRLTTDLAVTLPATLAAAGELSLFLVSDTMRGIDQAHALKFAPPPA